jgi:hypothetical protein
MCWFLLPFIRSRVSGLTQFCSGSNKGTASMHQILCKSRTFLSRVILPGEKSKLSETDEEQSQHAHHFCCFASRRLFKKNSSWEAKQSFLWLCENVRILHPRLWWLKNLLLHYNNAPSHTSFFTMEFFIKNKMTYPPPTLLFCFPNWR